ncbi:MAG: hypothetical protein ACRCZ4_07955, partial [Plesiomonas sp.]|uniref:hypothetical protein n=1 Tax=Plesiomonas sp. TaxID=2486279 RepID=UPI003F2DD8C5
ERPVIRALLDGLDVGTEKEVSTSVAEPQVATAKGLHYAAPQVASALTGLLKTAKPSAVATSASRATLATPTLTENSLSHLPSSSAQRSLIGELNNGEPMGRTSQQPKIVSKDAASASVTAGSGIKDTAPPLLVKALENVPTNTRSDWSGLRFESVLPSSLNATSLRDQASAQRELVRGLRMFMQPGAAVPLAIRRGFEALRDNVLPRDPLLCSERLKRLDTEGSSADHQQLGELSNLMKDQRFGFQSQRAQAAQFASRLIRNTDLLKGKPHAMINQLLEGVGISSDEAKRLQMTSVTSPNSRVVLSELGALTRDLLTRPLETNKGTR